MALVGEANNSGLLPTHIETKEREAKWMREAKKRRETNWKNKNEKKTERKEKLLVVIFLLAFSLVCLFV